MLHLFDSIEKQSCPNKECSIVQCCSCLIARLRLEDQHCLPAITDDTALEYLVPTTSGAGALTTSLVDYLIQAHNGFIEMCSGRVKDSSQTYVPCICCLHKFKILYSLFLLHAWHVLILHSLLHAISTSLYHLPVRFHHASAILKYGSRDAWVYKFWRFYYFIYQQLYLAAVKGVVVSAQCSEVLDSFLTNQCTCCTIVLGFS